MNRQSKIRGALYGTALGDALGLGAEFMTRHEVKYYYPDGLRHFDQIIRDAHRSQFKHGEWTNDTEILLRLIECVIANKGFDLLALVGSMREWIEAEPQDLAPVIRKIMNNPEWIDNPISVSHKTWKNSGVKEASNEAFLRGIVTGITSPRRDLIRNTRELVQCTHDDTRCIASTTMLALAAHNIFHHDRIPTYEELYEVCEVIDSRTLPYLEMASKGDIKDFELDDEDTQLYTRKTMAAALWSLWHTDNAEDAIYKVIDMAGDADTNAAAAGALAGLRYGFEALPNEKDLIIRKDYLDDISIRLHEFLEEAFPAK